MARLCPRYNLCPLIDRNTLLGVTEISSSGCVIVTLGKNIIIRYKLFNQKQTNSWSSTAKLSSPVVYDEVGSQYYAVFAHNYVRMWTEDEKKLDKLKKIRFEDEIYRILPQTNGEEPLLIFKNGIVEPFRKAVNNRKEKHKNPLLTSEELILNCHLVDYETCTFIILFCRKSTQNAYFHVIPVSKDISPAKLTFTREDVNLVGETILKEENSCHLLTLWSDGKLYSLPILPMPCSKPPGSLINTVRAVSTKHVVAMIALSSSHLALYGANSSEEGAALVIYNILFGVVQSRQSFKLFPSPPRLWQAGTNLLLTTAGSLVVAPYELDSLKLSALVGAKCKNTTNLENNSDIQEVHYVQYDKWITNHISKDISNFEIPESIKKSIQELEANGYPQTVMIEKILPKLLEEKAVNEIHWCITNFTDIPESSLAHILNMCMENISDSAEQESYKKLLNTILCTSYSDVLLLPHMRTAPFHQALVLLDYLAKELETEEPQVELNKVLEWMILLLDAHYQRYLLSGDSQVTDLLFKLHNLVNNQISYMNDLKGLLPLLEQLKKGNIPVKHTQISTLTSESEILSTAAAAIAGAD